MKRTVMFTRLFVKRLLKKPSFLLILLIMPAIIFSFRLVLEKDDDSLRVAIINEDDNEHIVQLVDKLCNENGAISFYLESSEEHLKKEVLNGHADSGFVIKNGSYKALSANDAKGTIRLYSSNKSTVYYYALEKIYAELYHSLAYEYMLNTLENKGFYDLPDVGTREEGAAFTKEIFEYYIEDGGIFTIYTVDDNKLTSHTTQDILSDNNYLMRPVKGALAVFVMLAALSGAIYLIIDEKNGVYKTLAYSERPFVNLAAVFIPTMLGGIVAYISLWISGIEFDPIKEAGVMLGYVMLLVAVVNLLRSILRNEILLCSLLPLLVVLSIIGCDVFIDLSIFARSIETIRYLLPPQYFLEVFRTPLGALISLGAVIIISLLGVIIDRKKMR